MFAILLTEGMDPFYQNIGSFPTVVFTFFLAVALVYWVVAVLGLVDIGILDFDVPDLDGNWHVNPDAGLTTPEALAGIMLRFGLHGVPITIVVSFIALFGWLACYYMVHFLLAWIESGVLRFLLGLPILVVALYIGVVVTGLLIKPLRPLFKKAQLETTKHVLGQTAVVRSSRVDSEFGEAILEDGGAGLILKVRCEEGESFAQGDKVVLLERLEDENAYRVISEQEFLR